jgi:hypothetical protein
VAFLHVVLFGQVLGGVALNIAGASCEYTASRFDPARREFSHSSYPAMWLATAAALASKTGRRSGSVLNAEQPFVFVEDGPEGPTEISVPAVRADSPVEALRIVSQHRRDGPKPSAIVNALRQQTR